MKKVLLLVLVLLLSTSKDSQACTNFQIEAQDKSVIVGRTMEYPTDLRSKIWVVPRGTEQTSANNQGVKNLYWNSKYAYIGIDGFDLGSIIDGMNEKGLSVNGLMYTGAKYQDRGKGKFVTYADLGSWILANFSTVDEVKKELPNINVIDKYIKEFRGSLGLHMAVHDASGKSIVIEFINGEQKISDNNIGILTNRPSFDQQMTNLRNYINLQADNKEARMVNGVMIEPAGAGSGMLGLPGDWTPPSRFVKMAYVLDAVAKPKTAVEAVNLAEHVMNTVDIPKGVIKEKDLPKNVFPNTQWSVIYDLKNKIMYFRTYDNLTLRKIELSKLTLSEGTDKKRLAISKKFSNTIDAGKLFN